MSTQKEPCLEADGIMLSYRHTNVLSNIYLKCRPGEIVGLLGRNGCGKASLLKIIFGVLAEQCQSVRVDGRSLLLLLSDARYLLLDEPFTHLSPVQIERLLHLLRTHGAGKGIILSDHQYRYVLSLCHRVVLLAQGRTITLNDPQELVDWGYINAL